jgi:hypothetical protein
MRSEHAEVRSPLQLQPTIVPYSKDSLSRLKSWISSSSPIYCFSPAVPIKNNKASLSLTNNSARVRPGQPPLDLTLLRRLQRADGFKMWCFFNQVEEKDSYYNFLKLHLTKGHGKVLVEKWWQDRCRDFWWRPHQNKFLPPVAISLPSVLFCEM